MDQYYALILALLFPLSLLVLAWFIGRSSKPTNKGFRMYPVVGVLPDFLRNRHRFLEWTTSVLTATPTNTAFLRRPGNVRGVLTANPANVEHVLKTNFQNYPKGDQFIHRLHDFLGHGIFNADDELWRYQRKTASFEFNKRSLRNFVVDCVSSEIHTRLLPLLSHAAQSPNRLLDFQDVLERFTFDNVCKVAFNFDPVCLSVHESGQPEFMSAFVESTTLSCGRFFKVLPIIWKIQSFFNMGSEYRLRKSITTVHQFMDQIILDRLRLKQEDETSTFNPEEDLLSRFIATDEKSPEFLRDMAVSFILAGKDTTSSALTWFFWLLSSHPEVTLKIRSEIESVRTRSGKTAGECFDYDDVKEMQYLHAALSEAMRLYPPVPVDTKLCRNDDVLPDGTEVKKGWFVTYHMFAMGRMERIWGKDCEEFRPERWMVDMSGSASGKIVCKAESPFRYPVFNGGARVCLGKEMAYIQMKSVAASVLESFDLEVQLGKATVPEYVMALTLRMKGGLPVTVKRN